MYVLFSLSARISNSGKGREEYEENDLVQFENKMHCILFDISHLVTRRLVTCDGIKPDGVSVPFVLFVVPMRSTELRETHGLSGQVELGIKCSHFIASRSSSSSSMPLNP